MNKYIRLIFEKLNDLFNDDKIFNNNDVYDVIGKQLFYLPKNFDELRVLIEKLLDERGPNANLNDIDVSEVTIIYDEDNDFGLFEGLDPHNIDISEWDVSNVENMGKMFYRCRHFNCNLSKWKVNKVINMDAMFYCCYEFKGEGLSEWDVSNVEYMYGMFYRCKNLDCNLGNWDMSEVKDMCRMFSLCSEFKGEGLENWKPIKCKNMSYMFSNCKNFNCNLSGWDVSNVEDMSYMFYYCKNFIGKGLNSWKPIKCENMECMFSDCENFDCNLSGWDVSNVLNTLFMFCNCKKFTGKGLNSWKLIKGKNMECMFSGCTSLKKIPRWHKKHYD